MPIELSASFNKADTDPFKAFSEPRNSHKKVQL